MNSIILHLLTIIQYQYRQICWLILFISKYIPLKQWAFDDSHSPKYQKFKTDILPNVIYYEKVEYQWLLENYKLRYGKVVKPVNRRSECDIPEEYAPVLTAMLLCLISTRTMARKGKYSAKSVVLHLALTKIDFPNSILFGALTALTPWFRRKTASTLLFTNV